MQRKIQLRQRTLPLTLAVLGVLAFKITKKLICNTFAMNKLQQSLFNKDSRSNGTVQFSNIFSFFNKNDIRKLWAIVALIDVTIDLFT